MKKCFYLTSLCLLSFVAAVAQGKKYPKPAHDNTIYLLDQDGNTLTELENPKFRTEKRHVGIWGNENVIVMAGTASNIRVSKKSNAQFIIHFDRENANPNAECVLNMCEVKAQREYIDTKSGAHGTAKQASADVKFEKVGPGLYLLTLPIGTVEGEYFFMESTTNEAYAFGLDR